MDQLAATGADIASAYLLLGILMTAIVLALLIVFFVSPKAFPRKEYMGAVWPLFKRHFWLLLAIVIIQQVLANLPSAITGVAQGLFSLGENEPISAILSFVAMIVIVTILQAGLVGIMLTVVSGGTPRLGDLFSKTRVFWRYLGCSILYGLITVGGFFLLVFPGVIWFLKFSLWSYFIVDKNAGVIEALKMSSQATKGYKPSLFVLYIYLMSLNLLGLSALFVGFFVTAPMTLLILAWVYRRLSGGVGTPSAVPKP
ncbi:hypothetical protein HY623_00040 [Candidatus Uhrbacteria bacterium]|nr:hypothetical protein [Candidatus Uhrbacteria bacterium]